MGKMAKPSYSTLIRFVIVLLPCIEGASRLNEYVHQYEALDYSADAVHQNHLRVKRWTGELNNVDKDEPHVRLEFKAHNRNFKLRLKRDTSTFSPSLVVTGDAVADGAPVDTSHIYSGDLEGIPQSHVFGSLRNGVFEGKVITPDDNYYVERSNKFPHLSTNASLHSVIYNEKDVQDPYHHLRTGHAKGCGLTDEVASWMESVQNSAVEDMPELKHPKSKVLVKHHSDPFFHGALKTNDVVLNSSQSFSSSHHSVVSRQQDRYGSSFFRDFPSNHLSYYRSSNFEEISRRRRSTSTGGGNLKTTCTLSIQTDPLLWKHISDQEKTKDEHKIKEEILSVIAQHVKAVNHIYANTLFNGSDTYKNIRFEVQRIKIDTDEACHPNWKGEENRFCMENIDVSNFLNLHSLSKHEEFCLSYVFTYRDFTGGTLGLAWVASASGASGGICEKYKTYTETIQGVYKSTKRSLNTGIITFVNYNSRVPPKVSQLTLAHEIGHNFGSPHDYPDQCRPGGQEGNFIMFASATSGDRPNNSKFSFCSVSNISDVLDAVMQGSKKQNCFIATNGTFCGNKIVEEGEECDCGFTVDECDESCCYPRQVPAGDLRRSQAEGCRRKPNTICSPSEGPCCQSGCIPARRLDRIMCKHETECSESSYCDGNGAQCPKPVPKEDLTPCNNGTQVCQDGQCQGSICLKYQLEECFLSSSENINDKRKLCELACFDRQGNCKSTSELNLPDLPKGLSLRPGAPCDNFKGYCDVFLKCRAVDAEGPLARLKNLLFNKETLHNIVQWITAHWWAVCLILVGFVIFMGVFIKCCAVHTPSSNPKKPPARRIQDTLRRPISTLRRPRNPNRYRPANSHAANGNIRSSAAPSGAPPPYSAAAAPAPGPVTSQPPGGPAHGFGKNRGPNRAKGSSNSNHKSSSSGGVGGNNKGHKSDSRHQQHRV